LKVNITDSDPNPWVECYTSSFYNVFFSGFLTCFNFFCFYEALKRLIGFVRVQGPKFIISQFTLSIQVLTNGIRLVNLVIDPVHTRGIIAWQVASIWHTITLPLGLMCSLSLTLFWHETISKKMVNSSINFIKKFKIPFIITSAVILTLDVISSILRAMYYPFTLVNIIEMALFIVITISISIFYFITGCKILRQLEKSKKIRRGASKTKNVTRLVMLSSIGNIITCVGAVFLGVDSNDPYPYLISWWIFYFGLGLTSLIQTLAFTPPPGEGRNKGTGSLSGSTRVSNLSRGERGSRISSKYVAE